MNKDTRRKASQWSFSFPWFTAADVDRISNLPSVADDVQYITAAVCDDDTGKRYLQGFVKMTRRCRVGPVRTLIGPAIFSIVVRVPDVLVDIRMNEFFEYGDLPCQHHEFCRELESFKRNVDSFPSLEAFGKSHPIMFTQYLERAMYHMKTQLIDLGTPHRPGSRSQARR
jgi:hypothetical protein